MITQLTEPQITGFELGSARIRIFTLTTHCIYSVDTVRFLFRLFKENQTIGCSVCVPLDSMDRCLTVNLFQNPHVSAQLKCSAAWIKPLKCVALNVGYTLESPVNFKLMSGSCPWRFGLS